jgi:hypothetical protein
MGTDYEDLNDHDPLRHGIAKTQLPENRPAKSDRLLAIVPGTGNLVIPAPPSVIPAQAGIQGRFM